MRVRVLGCDGGELWGHKSSCFLLDGTITIDAGAICSSLKMEELLQIDHILISHTHLDHIKDLGLLADLVIGRRQTPVEVYGTAAVVDILQQHYFNDKIWPDFTKIPSPQNPVMRLKLIEPYKEISLGNYHFRAIPVNHPVETSGFIFSWPGGSLVYSGDTGPTQKLWEEVNRCTDVKAIFLDVSFPNFLQSLADVSGHLTPMTAALEIKKVADPKIPIYFYHLKPGFYQQVLQELAPLLNQKKQVFQADETYHF